MEVHILKEVLGNEGTQIYKGNYNNLGTQFNGGTYNIN